ncbi:MAG: hypothetical protein IJ250_01840 [Bacteroidales bacterium]|nr:hypothetical protein [Bacteroidales bacterium]
MKKILIITLLTALSLPAFAQKTVGNIFLLKENFNTHSFQLNIGYNAINNNTDQLYKDIKGFPLGFSYQWTRKGSFYIKFTYTNFALHSALVTGAEDDHYKGMYYEQKYKDSQHMVNLAFGLVNSASDNHVFQMGLSGGLMMWMKSMDGFTEYYLPVYTDDGVKDEFHHDNNSNSDNKTYPYVGLDLGYKYYITDNIYLGFQAQGGYLFDMEEIAYSLTLNLGYTFKKGKNFRF